MFQQYYSHWHTDPGPAEKYPEDIRPLLHLNGRRRLLFELLLLLLTDNFFQPGQVPEARKFSRKPDHKPAPYFLHVRQMLLTSCFITVAVQPKKAALRIALKPLSQQEIRLRSKM